MKLLCTVSKILMCCKLCHETPIEDDLSLPISLLIKASIMVGRKVAKC